LSPSNTFRLSAIVDGEWWRALAACKGVPIETYYNKKYKQQALAYCQSCPVSNCCLDYALRFEPEFGIFGGFTATQRSRYRPELTAYVDRKLRNRRWGSVAVLGSDNTLDEAEHGGSTGQRSTPARRQVSDDKGGKEGLKEGK